MITSTMIDQYNLKRLPADVYKNSEIHYFKNGDIITSSEENQTQKRLLLLLQGRAKVIFLSNDGESTLLEFLNRNDWIGELELVGVTTSYKQVVSLGSSVCLAIPQAIVTKYLINDVAFLQQFNHYLANKIIKRTDLMLTAKAYSFKERLATFMLNDAYNSEYSEPHRLVMEYLGISYRHLLYTYNQLVDEGFIDKIGRNKYRLNMQRIESLIITPTTSDHAELQ